MPIVENPTRKNTTDKNTAAPHAQKTPTENTKETGPTHTTTKTKKESTTPE